MYQAKNYKWNAPLLILRISKLKILVHARSEYCSVVKLEESDFSLFEISKDQNKTLSGMLELAWSLFLTTRQTCHFAHARVAKRSMWCETMPEKTFEQLKNSDYNPFISHHKTVLTGAYIHFILVLGAEQLIEDGTWDCLAAYLSELAFCVCDLTNKKV